MNKKTFYLSNDGFWPFSGRLEQVNADGSDGPFGHFRQALEKISEMRRSGNAVPIEVIIKEGVYRLTEPLYVPPAYSGDITFKARDGKQVVITSNKVIDGFAPATVDGKPLWKANVPLVACGEWDFGVLSVNGRWRDCSSFPKDKVVYIKDIPSHPLQGDDSDVKSFYLDLNDVGALGDLTGATLNIANLWRNYRMPVMSYDAGTGYVQSDRYSMRNLRDELPNLYARYQVENTLGGLTQPGEWCLCKQSGDLYYWPMEGETLENAVIEAPRTDQLVVVQGYPDQGQYVRGVKFENIIFAGADYTDEGIEPKRIAHMHKDKNKRYACSAQAAHRTPGAVRLTGAVGCGFYGCRFQNLGGYALDINAGCSYTTVQDCEISYCGAGGVRITGGDHSNQSWKQTGFNCVENNDIHDLTKIFYGAIGIALFDTFSNRLAHNEIYNLKYSGISAGWVWGMQESNTHHNTIEYNHIHDLGDGTLSDMGAIYLLGEQPGTRVAHNHIHHVLKANYGGWGIYLDEGSAYVTVEKNIVHHVACEPLHIHFGKENIIRYNIFAFGGEGQVRLGRNNEYNNLTMIKNIILTDNKPIYGGGYAFVFKEGAITTDGNFIWDTGGADYFIDQMHSRYQGPRIMDLGQWQAMGFDTMSVFGDPGFVDYTTFALPETSYVYKYGFPKDVTVEKTGKIK